jgi:hypothetical protein
LRGKTCGPLKPSASFSLVLLFGAIILGSHRDLSGQSLRRIPSDRLVVPLAGVSVIRDSTAWRILWDRFARPRRLSSGDTLEVLRRPRIAFADTILIAIAPGGVTGCDNSLRMVEEIREFPDSVVVRYSTTGVASGIDAGGGLYITCQAFFTPIDIVAIRRTSAPILFRPYQVDSPLPPAPWWDRPSIAALDSMPRLKRVVYLDALAMDPSVRGRYLLEIARRPVDGYAAYNLLSRPEVQRDWRALRTIWGHGDDLRTRAQRLILDLPTASLAENREAPRDLLELLIGDLIEHPSTPGWVDRLPGRQNRANALLRNSSVLGDVELLARMVYSTQFLPDLHARVCRAYLGRYPRTREWVGTDGMKYQQTVICPVPAQTVGQ